MAIVRNIKHGGGSSGNSIIVVTNYSALPDPTTVSGQFYWCENSQGTSWLPGSLGGTYYNSGMYYSNGVSWSFVNVPYQATQSEVNAGTNTDKFVTPDTLKNSTQFQFLDATSSIQGQLNSKLNLSGGSLTGALNQSKSTDIASASTTDLATSTGNLVHITGTTTITSFGTLPAGAVRNLVFDGVLTIVNSANIIIPTGASTITSVGDVAIVVSEGSGVWRFLSYQKYYALNKLYIPIDQATTSLTAIDINYLTMTLEPNSMYEISGFMRVGSGSANGHALAVVIPSGATMRIQVQSRGATNTELNLAHITTSGTLTGALNTTTSSFLNTEIFGTITTGVTGGIFKIQMASVTSGTTTIYREGTLVKLDKIY